MKNGWLKLYHEILHDPKMGKMSDHQFRRTIEIFLLAGMNDKDGFISTAEDIAWSLRTTKKDIQKVLSELVNLNIITETTSGYYVTHFMERQNSEKTKSETNREYYQKKKSEIQKNSENNESEIQKNSENDESENKTLEKKRKDKTRQDKDIEETRKEIEETRKEENSDAVASNSEKPKKHRHGNFSHVLLTDDDYEKLCNQFPDVEIRIQQLDNYLENNPKKSYANHYLTILTWSRKDGNQPIQNTLPQPKRTYTFQEVGEMRRRGEL